MKVTVDSTWIAGLEWLDSPKQEGAFEDLLLGDVIVSTVAGSDYLFYGVPRDVFDAWLTAPSKGQYYHKHIKDKYLGAPGGVKPVESSTGTPETAQEIAELYVDAMGPDERWENGEPHHPISLELFKHIAALDCYRNGDAFCWKSGGDGDNGEQLMYILDMIFEKEDSPL